MEILVNAKLSGSVVGCAGRRRWRITDVDAILIVTKVIFFTF